MKKYKLIILVSTMVISFASCMEKKTDDPNEAYKLWTGETPKGIQIIHGKYWQSGHWTKEYTVYLEIKTTSLWRKEFIKQNNLVESKEKLDIPTDAPAWFTPSKNFKALKSSESSEGSAYFEDTVNETMFIYEIQL